MKNDDFSNFHLFINLQPPQPACRPAQKRPFFARASRTVFTEIIISAFFAVASPPPLRPVDHHISAVCSLLSTDSQIAEKHCLTSFMMLLSFNCGNLQKIVGNLFLFSETLGQKKALKPLSPSKQPKTTLAKSPSAKENYAGTSVVD